MKKESTPTSVVNVCGLLEAGIQSKGVLLDSFRTAVLFRAFFRIRHRWRNIPVFICCMVVPETFSSSLKNH